MKFYVLPALSLAVALVSPAQSRPVYQDPAQPAAARARAIVSEMTLEEKAQQLEDYATAIPRLGIKDYQTWNEALHGVARAGYATVFPQAIGMAATWDPAIVRQMGDVVAMEGRAKYNQAQREGNHRIFFGLTFWSPNINIFRDPRWGRGQETYGEDPFLTGRIGTAFITGVQGTDPEHPKAIATSKHFAVHSGPESLRHTFDVQVSPRDLEETYLPAFRSTVVDGKVKSVMCAYNAIDTFAACASTMLLKDHLRDAWKFSGFVVSDCGAIVDVTRGHKNAPDITHAAAVSLKAGTDLSCSIWSPGFNTLANAVKQGIATEAEVTQAAERLYTARYQLGLMDPPGKLDQAPFSVVAGPANREIARKAAEETMVLLKNDGALPLVGRGKKIAVVGPTADLLVSLEGNYNGQPVNPVTPLEGLQRQFGAGNIRYAQGATVAEGVNVPVPATAFGKGLKVEYFNGREMTGAPVATGTDSTIQHDWDDALPVPGITSHDYSVRWTGTLTPLAPGKYNLTLESVSAFPYSPRESYRLLIDGKVVAEGQLDKGKLDMGNFNFAPGTSSTAPPVMSGTTPGHAQVEFNDTEPHDLRLEYSHYGDHAGGGMTLKWDPPAQPLLDGAVAAARASDVVVAFVGLSPQLEGEEMPVKSPGFAGGDRTSIDLPATQVKLLEAVAANGQASDCRLAQRKCAGDDVGSRPRRRHPAGVVPGRRRRNGDSAHAGWRKQPCRPAACPPSMRVSTIFRPSPSTP